VSCQSSSPSCAECFGATLERQPEYADVLVVGRKVGEANFSKRGKQALQALLPHLARAWRVTRAMAEMEVMVGSLKLVLDRIDRAVVIAGPDGEIRFANQSADRLLGLGDAIDATHGRLCALRAGDTTALRTLIARAAGTAATAKLFPPGARIPFE